MSNHSLFNHRICIIAFLCLIILLALIGGGYYLFRGLEFMDFTIECSRAYCL
ncbi:hypothetical protein EDC56_1852 [Sinobacterium caligoides]|uniref:Uncharacterized protein n=1 Tax=Sinobacterium caligoides TaxID=933926 RepID=A0A3N2DNM5_9GAMM|nr:hypothetical protein [Sinobacterium caligoides]ROS01411.1 hypothetical protein EDC56_1852 [Sinobacterium caligoides]